MQDCGAWVVVLLVCAINNADHAPWDDARWFAAGRKAVDTDRKISIPEYCCAFVELLPLVCMDMNLTGSTLDSELAQEISDSLADVYAVNAEKIGIQIWFNFIRAMRYYLFIWHRRLLICW